MTAVTEGSGAATWRGLTARQQPDWPDRQRLKAVTSELAALPPLIFPDECDQLRERLAAVTRGEAFILQGGDCAETFEGATADAVRAKLQTLLQMALVLTYGASVPVVKIARMAGQFAKPRSSQTETRDGVELPAYRGDAVNGFDFTPEARTPDPDRLLRSFQLNYGLTSSARPCGGWEAPHIEVRGHNTGHLMSALALTWASTGDRSALDKGSYLVRELAALQARAVGAGAVVRPSS